MLRQRPNLAPGGVLMNKLATTRRSTWARFMQLAKFRSNFGPAHMFVSLTAQIQWGTNKKLNTIREVGLKALQWGSLFDGWKGHQVQTRFCEDIIGQLCKRRKRICQIPKKLKCQVHYNPERLKCISNIFTPDLAFHHQPSQPSHHCQPLLPQHQLGRGA